MENKNPYIEPENYFSGYQESIDGLKNRPDIIEFDKLCYLTFQSEDGKKLMEVILERYVIPGFVHPNSDGAGHAALYYEGFKEAFRMIRSCISSHKQRIEAESTKE